VNKMETGIPCFPAQEMEVEVPTKESVQPGDMVLLKDDDAFVRTLPLGRVVKVYTGSAGLVKAVEVFVKGKTYRRPLSPNWLNCLRKIKRLL